MEVEGPLSTQYWRKVVFKDQEIWAECASGGELLERSGKVRIVYKQGTSKSYSTFKDRLKIVPSSIVEEFDVPLAGP